MYSCHSSENEESPKEHHQKIAKRRTFCQELSQLPSLPKPPIISLSSQTSEATTSKIVYQTQSNETLSSVPNKTRSTLHYFNDFNFSQEEIQSDCNVNDLCPNDFKKYMIKGMATLLRKTQNLDNRISSIEVKENQAGIEEHNEEEFYISFSNRRTII